LLGPKNEKHIASFTFEKAALLLNVCRDVTTNTKNTNKNISNIDFSDKYIKNDTTNTKKRKTTNNNANDDNNKDDDNETDNSDDDDVDEKTENKKKQKIVN
jgi:hypothetical protein